MIPPSPIVQDLLTHLARLGVREFCVAAGARNAQIIAALQASRGIKIWNFFEERCAGFFALGRMIHDRAPVAVVTTSGTAAAELLPAVIEAHYQGLPLIVITADRPPHYRGSGAPQAIEQVGLFGSYALPTIDITGETADLAWPTALSLRPLHINICLEEGVAADTAGIDFENLPASDAAAADHAPPTALLEFLRHDPVVLAGGLHPAQATALWSFLENLGAPVIAEATANLHGHPCLVRGGEAQLAALNPSHVLRLGSVPSWRWWRDLEDRSEVSVLNLTPSLFPGLARKENVRTFPLSSALPSVPRSERQLPADILTQSPPLSEAAWMDHLAAAIPPGARVFLGNSLPIREFNQIKTPLHRDTVCYANRGANGIDGLVSTFLGISATASESWIILGDLSALYDLAAPWIIDQLPPGNRRIVVINNGGGKIFSKVASLRSLPDVTRAIIENRHTLTFAPWADLWHIPYRQATHPHHLQNLADGPVLIEVTPS
ncbi:MAG: 2-succinyl-5-enolpyruvyl-6-hydroxy-3-cyclohexene-1-carboxylic-acid synthase [Prosthecobacter sp.]|nr:2-succinyl-5-enolpyruvyl-6-hydroxy-3-cyclohexene-1-carboxylic-acid synthase [Prosthecobacter sp.]